jgi:octopine/nopaline transport system permease protein
MEFGLVQVWEGGWVGAILRGAAVTIAVGVASMIFGLIIGTICGLIKWRAVFGLSQMVDLYTSVIRGVPELLIIYLLFFGSVEFVTKIATALALGLPSRRIFARIIAPQMLRIAFPGINNVWQTTIKDTALVSVVGLQELMRTAFIGAGSTHNPLIFYSIAALVYLMITLTSQVGFNRVETLLSPRKGA